MHKNNIITSILTPPDVDAGCLTKGIFLIAYLFELYNVIPIESGHVLSKSTGKDFFFNIFIAEI